MARYVAWCGNTGWLQWVGVHPVIGRLLTAAVVLDHPAFTDTRGDATHTWRADDNSSCLVSLKANV